MAQQWLIRSLEKTKQRIARRETSAATAQSFRGKLHPIAQMQRMLGNRDVAQLIRARRLTPGGKIIDLRRKLSVGAAASYAPEARDGRPLVAHELARVVPSSLDHMPQIQRQPEIEMPAEDFNLLPADPALIKSRRGSTDWIKVLSAGGSLDEKQWKALSGDIKKLYSDIARTAQAEKVFAGPAAVSKVAEDINVITTAADSRRFLPGLNFSKFAMDRGQTFYVDAKGGEPVNKLSPSRADPLPKVAIVLGSAAFSSKAVALTVLRHELTHAEHLTLALTMAKKWAGDAKTKFSFDDWLNEQQDKAGLSLVDLELIKGAVDFKSADTELLAYIEGFMTAFLLAQPPANNDDPAFLELYGVITSGSEPWANAHGPIRSEALGRLQEFFCRELDRPHQKALERFILKPPTRQTTNAAGWTWAPKRQMHQHFFDGLKKIVDNKCAGLSVKRGKASAAGGAKK